MKKIVLLVFAIAALHVTGCSKVPAGNAGVKVYLLGGKKGVDTEILGPGRYWIGINEELHLFPLFTVTYTWTKEPIDGDATDESITFQTKEGLSCNADVGISYHIEPDKVADVFQKYRKGIDEITDMFLRNMVRDAFVAAASTKPVESVYGIGKAELISEAEKLVREQTAEIGIVVENLYYTGELRLPPQVIEAVNKKIEATQRAQQRENELREAQAEAQKKIAQADGEAKSIIVKAEAESKAIQLRAAAITPAVIQYESITKWDGKLPTFQGGQAPIPFINLPVSSTP